AAPLDENLAQASGRRLNCKVNQGYGMTEASPVTHLVSDDIDWVKVGSIGPVVAGTECKVVDITTGKELGPETDGEILVRGPQVMKGYLNNPTATAHILDKDGWLHTGDIGHADAAGDFYVVDRLKELIKYKGYQVPPAELEGNLRIHESARAIVVFAHGSGSSRHSPRNRFVADHLASAGLGTLLIDLLTRREEIVDMENAELRFDVRLLAGRLGAVTDWLAADPATAALSIGYFGAS